MVIGRECILNGSFFDILGDIPQVHLSSELAMRDMTIDVTTKFLILTSDGLWKARHFFQSLNYLHSYY